MKWKSRWRSCFGKHWRRSWQLSGGRSSRCRCGTAAYLMRRDSAGHALDAYEGLIRGRYSV